VKETGIPRFYLGDVVELKKKHPCGSVRWEITRTGIDIGIRCQGCGRRVLIERREFEKRVRRVVSRGPGADEA